MAKFSLVLAIASTLVHHVAALLNKGAIAVPSSKPTFLSKFCFDFAADGGNPPPGSIHMDFLNLPSPQTGTYQVVIFDDQAESFPDESAYHDWKCDSPRLKKHAKFLRTINASEPYWRTTMTVDQKIRPRWWYVAVIDCSGSERELEYSLHWRNPRKGWQMEFSMDQCSVMSLGPLLIAYSMLAIAQLKAVTQKSGFAQTKHPLRLLLLASIFCAAFGLLAFVVDAVLFSRSGQSHASLHLTGKLFKACSKLTMASMLLLLSQGIGINHQFRLQDLRILEILMPFFAICFALETWGEYSLSRTYTTGFVYCTWVGLLVVFFDICLLGGYLRSLRNSYTSSLDADKKSFYQIWGTLYSSAFVALPFATFLSTILAPWVRSAVIVILTNSVHVFLLTLLVVGLWPEQTHTFFCIDKDILPKTIGGTTTNTLLQTGADSSPCLLKTRRPSCDHLKKGVDDYFSLDGEETMLQMES